MAWPTAKPNNTSFDADSDRISASRADLLTMSQAVNDIVDFLETSAIGDDKVLQYNSSTGKLEFVSPNTIGATVETAQILASRNVAPGSNGIITSSASGTFTFDSLSDVKNFVTIVGDSAGEFTGFTLASGTYLIQLHVYYNGPGASGFYSNQLEFDIKKSSSSVAYRRHLNGYDTYANITTIQSSTGSEVFEAGYAWTVSSSQNLTFKEMGPATDDPFLRIEIMKITT